MAPTHTKPDVRWWNMTILVVVAWTISFFGSVLGGRNPNILCPEACSCLSSVVACSRLRLKALPADLPSWVTDLELQANKLTELEADAFVHLVHMERLDLSNNKIRNISVDAFRGLSRLQELKLYRNRLLSFPPLGRILTNLTHLVLHHNRITEIHPEDLANLPSLTYLDLSYNRLSSIPSGVFPLHNILNELDLQSNRISSLSEGSFLNLDNLTVLKLAKNQISSLEAGQFAGLNNLRTLNLDRNELQTIKGLVFKELISLESLSLRRNQISEVLDGAFYNSGRLITFLDLSWNAIPSIAKAWLYGLPQLRTLSLGHNQINETEPEGWNFLENLEHLNLSYNHLEFLEEQGFPRLSNLRTLYVDHNHIIDIAEGAFIGLSSVQTLDLSFNEISWRIQDMTGAFEGLTSIETLSLSDNEIRYLPVGAFSGLENVRKMDLRGNEITTISENVFEDLTRLSEMQLNTSSMLCNCKVSWFPEWVREAGFRTDVAVSCAHPENLQGRDMFDLSRLQMRCQAQPEPFIIQEPHAVAALRGDNVTLICGAASSSSSPLTVTWMKDGKPLENANLVNLESIGEDNSKHFTSALSLPYIKDVSQGKYTCFFENEFGFAQSRKAKVTVHVFPMFIKKPSSVYVRVTQTAKLECSATGHPTPEIAWKKDGGDDFPAARDRRFSVYEESDTFFIVEVKKADMGTYTCTAKNAAGTIMANATLTVLEDPYFVKPLKALQVGLEESAVLECHVDGSPPPVVTWFKDGQPFKTSDRHRLLDTDEAHLLIVMTMTATDEGSYTCRANNSEGFTEQTTTLKMLKSGGPFVDGATTTGIIIISVVCCIVGTSLIWVIIIYQTRKFRRRYAVPRCGENSLPAEIPSTSLNGSSEGTIHQETSSGVSSAATDKYQAENMSDCDSIDDIRRSDHLALPHHLRTAAIFPSEMDMEDRPEYGICLQHFPDHGIPEEDEVYKQLSSTSDFNNPPMYPLRYPHNPEQYPFLDCHEGLTPRCFSDQEDIPMNPLSFSKSNTLGCVGETAPLRSDCEGYPKFDERSFLSMNSYPYMPNYTKCSREFASDDEQKKTQKHKKSRFPFSGRKNHKCHISEPIKKMPLSHEQRTRNLMASHKPNLTEKLQLTKCPPHRKMDAGRRIDRHKSGHPSSSSTSQLPTTELFANSDLHVPDIPSYHSLQKLSTSTEV